MRHSIGGMWLLQLMVLFIFLFAAYIILTLNYSRTIKIKNEVVSMIEKYEGLNDESLELVNTFLTTSGYSTMGVCASKEQPGIYGASDLFGTTLEEAVPGEKYYYCVKKYKGTNLTNYYQVALFYKFNLPVIGETSHFNVKGTTSNFHSVDDQDYCYTIDGTCGNTNNNRPSSGSSIYDQTYTVSFNLNGGNGSISSQTVSRGNKARKPSNPTRNGYSFAGWRLNGKIYMFNESVYENITLVAQWVSSSSSGSAGNENLEPQLITVKFNTKGGTAISNQQIEPGSKITKPSDPTRDKFVFKGWYRQGDYSRYYDFNRIENYDVTLYASWNHTIVDYFRKNASKLVDATYCYSCDSCYFGVDKFGRYSTPANLDSIVCDAYIRDNPGQFTKAECMKELDTMDDDYTKFHVKLGVYSTCKPGEICYSKCSSIRY